MPGTEPEFRPPRLSEDSLRLLSGRIEAGMIGSMTGARPSERVDGIMIHDAGIPGRLMGHVGGLALSLVSQEHVLKPILIGLETGVIQQRHIIAFEYLPVHTQRDTIMKLATSGAETGTMFQVQLLSLVSAKTAVSIMQTDFDINIVSNIMEMMKPTVVLEILKVWLAEGENQHRAKHLCLMFSDATRFPEIAKHIKYVDNQPAIV